MKRLCFFVAFLLLVSSAAVFSQTNLAVDLGDPVYRIIELGELKGVLTRVSTVKPYSRSQVNTFLEKMLRMLDAFSPYEQGLIKKYTYAFMENPTGTTKPLASYEKGETAVQAGISSQADFRLNPNSDGLWHLASSLSPYIQGDLSKAFSYYASFGFTADKVNMDNYAPYDFTKSWDAFHISFGTPRYSDGTLAYPTFSYNLYADLAASFFDNALMLKFSRYRRDWGMGEGSLTLSGTARPFVGFEFDLRPVEWFSVSHLVGSLNDWTKEPTTANTGSGQITYQKLFALQRFEFFPADWLYLSAASTLVGAKRFELGYFSPLLFTLIYQNLIAMDWDNLSVQVDGAAFIPGIGKIYASFMADEMELTSNPFTKPRNMWAVQGGVKIAVPFIPLGSFTFQYTNIQPFVYAHFPSWYPDYRVQVDTSYTHDSENLGYHLPPNSDEFLIKLQSMPLWNLTTGIEYRLIRHGSHPSKAQSALVIHGEVDKWLDYSLMDSYPDKNFLKDGLYDYNHIVKLSGSYRFENLPIELGLSYTFAYTYWEANDSGEVEPADSIKNIIGLTVKLMF